MCTHERWDTIHEDLMRYSKPLSRIFHIQTRRDTDGPITQLKQSSAMKPGANLLSGGSNLVPRLCLCVAIHMTAPLPLSNAPPNQKIQRN